jgi:hypothetical protein
MRRKLILILAVSPSAMVFTSPAAARVAQVP